MRCFSALCLPGRPPRWLLALVGLACALVGLGCGRRRFLGFVLFSLGGAPVVSSASVFGPVVGFFGSRSWPASPVSGVSVAAVVAAVAGGRGVAVGCARGADEAALRARLVLPFPASSSPRLSVFAVGGSGGSGFAVSRGRVVSAFGSVRWAASVAAASPGGHGGACPVSVSWWAGGPASVPLRRRLAARSRAFVSFVASCASPGSGLVGFVCPGRSVGSWLSVRLGLLAGLPVVVFPSVSGAAGGFPSSFAGVGAVSWVPAARSGLWAAGFRAVVAPGA